MSFGDCIQTQLNKLWRDTVASPDRPYLLYGHCRTAQHDNECQNQVVTITRYIIFEIEQQKQQPQRHKCLDYAGILTRQYGSGRCTADTTYRHEILQYHVIPHMKLNGGMFYHRHPPVENCKHVPLEELPLPTHIGRISHHFIKSTILSSCWYMTRTILS